MRMQCSKCGGEIPSDSEFCPLCGEKDPGRRAGPDAPAPGPVGPTPPPQPVHPGRKVPNYLVHAIVVTILCCVPTGIVAIVYATQVNSKLQAGDEHGAIEASRKAKMWSWISVALGLVVGLLYLIGIAAEGM